MSTGEPLAVWPAVAPVQPLETLEGTPVRVQACEAVHGATDRAVRATVPAEHDARLRAAGFLPLDGTTGQAYAVADPQPEAWKRGPDVRRVAVDLARAQEGTGHSGASPDITADGVASPTLSADVLVSRSMSGDVGVSPTLSENVSDCQGMSRPGWDAWFVAIARVVAIRADCRKSRVGAVLVRPDRSISSVGYVGVGIGEVGCLAGGCPRAFADVEPGSSYDTGPGRCISTHAEANCLALAREDTTGHTLYVTREPCDGCYRAIRAHRLSRVVFPSL